MNVENTNAATSTPKVETATKESVQSETENERKQKIYYEDFVQKTIQEKKNAIDRLKELENENKKLKEEELIKKQNWEEMARQKEIEANEWKNKYQEKEQLIVKAAKAGALKKELSKLGCRDNAAERLVKLVDLNKIEYDAESGVVTGVMNSAKMLSEEFPELFGVSKVGVNQSAPVGTFQGDLTIEAYNKLPYAERQKVREQLYSNLGLKGDLKKA